VGSVILQRPIEGDRVRNKLTGTIYVIKGFRGKLAVLKAEDGSTEILTGKDSLKLFYNNVQRNINQ
jgi:hypothetical protein